MLGFVIGALSLCGLVKVLRMGRGGCPRRFGGWGARWGGCGAGFGGCHAGYDRWSRGDSALGCGWTSEGKMCEWGRDDIGGTSRRTGWPLRWILARLDATPAQEKLAREAYAEVRAALEVAEREFDASRSKLAEAIRAGHIDESLSRDLVAQHEEHLRVLSTSALGALSRVVEVLDEDQRRALAELVERHRSRFFDAGPYRGAHHPRG